MCGITGFYLKGKDYQRSNLNENLINVDTKKFENL